MKKEQKMCQSNTVEESKRERLRVIPDWWGKGLICSRCKTKRSVKYRFKDKNFCNWCILFEMGR